MTESIDLFVCERGHQRFGIKRTEELGYVLLFGVGDEEVSEPKRLVSQGICHRNFCMEDYKLIENTKWILGYQIDTKNARVLVDSLNDFLNYIEKEN